MPVYLLHGFRWSRPSIRIHIILQKLEDAAADWIVAPETQRTLSHNFHKLYPSAMADLPNLRFIEQYDPSDTTSSEQPYAYVADVVEEVKLGLDVDDVRGRGIGNEQWAAMMELRDKLAADEKIGWYIVVCGDEERLAPTPEGVYTSSDASNTASGTSDSDTPPEPSEKKPPSDAPEPKGLKKLWNSTRLSKRKSPPNTERDTQQEASQPPPTAVSTSQAPPSEPMRISTSPSDLGPKPTSSAGNITPITSTSDPLEEFAELSASPPTRDGLSDSTAPTSISSSGSVSPIKYAPSIAPSVRSTRSRAISISPYRQGSVAPSIYSVHESRAPSPSDTLRKLSSSDRVQSFSGLADAQRQKRASRRFSMQSLQAKSHASLVNLNGGREEEDRRTSRRLSWQSFNPRFSTSESGTSTPLPKRASTLPLNQEPVSEADEDELDEVILMSPATRAPTQTFRLSRNSRNSLLGGSVNNSQVYLGSSLSPLDENGLNSGPSTYQPTTHKDDGAESFMSKQPYFGQNVNQFDLIANNIENALLAMR